MTETKPQNRCFGYARVSTYGQTLAVQLEQLRTAGCTKIYREKVTGAKADRRELLKMLKHLEPFIKDMREFGDRDIAPPHSTTSSAAARSDGGSVRPRALAAFRLMTNSNLVG